MYVQQYIVSYVCKWVLNWAPAAHCRSNTVTSYTKCLASMIQPAALNSPETCLGFGHWLSVFASSVVLRWRHCSDQTWTEVCDPLAYFFSSPGQMGPISMKFPFVLTCCLLTKGFLKRNVFSKMAPFVLEKKYAIRYAWFQDGGL